MDVIPAPAAGDNQLALTADVACADEVRAAIAATVARFGSLDIVVNNAGICPLTPFDEITEDEWDRVLAVNLKGAFLVSQAAMPHVRAGGKPRPHRQCRVVGGQMGGVLVGAHYAASKAGLIGLTKSLARLLAPDRRDRELRLARDDRDRPDRRVDRRAAGARPGADPSWPVRRAARDRGGSLVPGERRGRVHHRRDAGRERRAVLEVMMALTREQLADLYYRMWLIRYFDEAARSLFMQNMLRGTTHTYTGEEAVAVGACAALRRDDTITSTHRGHGHCLAKGGDPRRMMAELLGRATGYCKGKGGSMHIADFDLGILGANGIVGGGIALATGAAYSADVLGDGPGDGLLLRRRREQPGHPDGSREHGRRSGSCPSSTCARRTSTRSSAQAGRSSRVERLELKAQACGMPGVTVDGNDVLAVYEAASAAVARGTSGRRTDLPGRADLPHRRSHRRRPAQLSHQRRDRAVEVAGARPDQPLWPPPGRGVQFRRG